MFVSHTHQTVNQKLISEKLLEHELQQWLPVLTLLIEFDFLIAFIFMSTVG